MDINLSLSPATTITNKLAVVIYKASAENVPVASQQFDPPHNSPRNITFSGVDPETYIVNTYETVGLPDTGTLRHSFIYEPSYQVVEIKATEFLYMTLGETSYTDEDWAGWEIDTIERVGQGTNFPSENINIIENGFELAVDGDRFEDGEKFVVRFKPKVTILTPLITSSKLFTAVAVITEDTTIDETYKGKLILVKGASSLITLTFKPIATIGALDLWSIVSCGGSHIRCAIKSEGNADKFLLVTGGVDEINLGQSESLDLFSYADEGFIVKNSSHGIFQVLEIVDSYNTSSGPNLIFANGTELDRIIYKRLFDKIPPDSFVTDAVWNTTTGGQNNKGFFSYGDGVNTFRLPLLYSAGYLKAINSTSPAGTFTAKNVGSHQHTNGIADERVEGQDSYVFVYGNTTTDMPGKSTGQLSTGRGANYQQGYTGKNNLNDSNNPDTYGVYKLIRF